MNRQGVVSSETDSLLLHEALMKLPQCLLLTALVLTLLGADSARAVLFYDTDDPDHNRSAPGGDYVNSGWQYEGYFGNFLGTMISPNTFITAAHFGVPAPNPLTGKIEFRYGTVFNGTGNVIYTVDTAHNENGYINGHYNIPGTDLRVYKINETFSSYAPLYTGSDEIGKTLVVSGRGGPRGAEVKLGDTLKGWIAGSTTVDWKARWGVNSVTDADSNYLAVEFNAISGVDEAHLSYGDSGGAVFINDGGTWKLAGINYAVDGAFDTDTVHPSGSFSAALFDMGGYYVENYDWSLIPDTGEDFPSRFYASRISTHLTEIALATAAAVPEPAALLMLAGWLAPWLVYLGSRRLSRIKSFLVG